jgi:hypothetical protein
VGLAVALGCSHPRPEEMSAEAHRGEAARHQAKAAEELKKSEEKAPTVQLPKGSPGSTPLGSYSAEHESHLRNADAERAHASEHLKAAQELEKAELKACKRIPPAERASCPLLAPSVQRVTEVERGVVLQLKPGAPVNELLGELQCHLAYERRIGYATRQCPLDVEGLTASPGPQPASIALVAKDAESAQTLRSAIRALIGPAL